MTQNIRNIFEHNIKLLGEMDKAVYYFREQQCDKALNYMADSIDEVRLIIEAIITDREYFNLVNTESMLEMLTGILEAKKRGDFTLLADLLELQLINFLLGVQELIISKEEIIFNEESYKENIGLLLERGEGFSNQLLEPINTTKLLESGYRVEFTSCGLMTLAAEKDGAKFYFHTNCKIHSEAFALAKHWYQKEKKNYIIYGFGMGYHIKELRALAPEAIIEVYEADANVLQLACAFTDMKSLMSSRNIKLVYDPELVLLQKKIATMEEQEAFYVHYPSYKNIRDSKGKGILEAGIPWAKTIEDC